MKHWWPVLRRRNSVSLCWDSEIRLRAWHERLNDQCTNRPYCRGNVSTWCLRLKHTGTFWEFTDDLVKWSQTEVSGPDFDFLIYFSRCSVRNNEQRNSSSSSGHLPSEVTIILFYSAHVWNVSHWCYRAERRSQWTRHKGTLQHLA